jgi:hypothetical protein
MQKLTKNQPVFAGGTSPEQALTTGEVLSL